MLKITNETSEDIVSGLRQRERNKLDKLRRIKAAARELFLEQGYDNATTREIARRADVGLGTLFSYASDKRDLLFLIYNDMQEAADPHGLFGAPLQPDVPGAGDGELWRLLPLLCARARIHALRAARTDVLLQRSPVGTLPDRTRGDHQRSRGAGARGQEAARAALERQGPRDRATHVRGLSGRNPPLAHRRASETGGGLARLRAMLRIVVEGLRPGPGAM